MSEPKVRYCMVIEAEEDPTDPSAIRRLRGLLKRLLRSHRLKCVSVEPVREVTK